MKTKIVFLHIPKTAGQTIHSEFERFYTEEEISPVRVHTQNKETCFPNPEKYSIFSGHLNWPDLNKVPTPRYVFTVVREPMTRIASFYFYMKNLAENMSEEELKKPNRLGARAIKENTIDDFFFSEDQAIRKFVYDHYDNFYTNYFFSRKYTNHNSSIAFKEKIETCLVNLKLVDDIFLINNLKPLQSKIKDITGYRMNFSNKKINSGPISSKLDTADHFFHSFEREENRINIQDLVKYDRILFEKMNIVF